MQDRAARVLALQDFLIFQSLEGIVGVANGKLRGVRVVRLFLGSGLEDSRVVQAVSLRETVGRAFGGCCLEVVHVAGGFLEFHHPLTDVVEDCAAHVEARGIGDVVGIAREVADHFVHAVDADGGEVIVQVAQVALRVREETVIHVVLNRFTLCFQAFRADVDQSVQFLDEALHVSRETVTQARHVNGDNTDGTGQLC